MLTSSPLSLIYMYYAYTGRYFRTDPRDRLYWLFRIVRDQGSSFACNEGGYGDIGGASLEGVKLL